MRSMTGFARAETLAENYRLELEIRTLNQRYLDLNFHLPATLTQIEPDLRASLKNRIFRGKVSISLSCHSEQRQEKLNVNVQRLKQLQEAMETVESQIIGIAQPSSLDVLNWPGVLDSTNENSDSLLHAASLLFEQALSDLEDTREREGKNLQQLIQEKLEQITIHIASIRALIPEINQRQQDQFETRARALGLSLDEHRLGAELALLVQRADVAEELDRLTHHVSEIEHQMSETGPIGRRIDFLTQELNREANTIASKSVVKETTLHAVELKVLIEQIREQVQNIE